jgi:Bacterial Ig-like domain (group 3)/Right handed beta helix region
MIRRWRCELILSCWLMGLLTASVWAQNTINVPGTAASIQAGINAASNGDTVLVAPGTYIENINFNGKAITVTSSGGPASTVIDGSQGAVAVSFVSGETRTSVINGFTIENAGAAIYPNSDPSVYFDGIKVSGSDPTITNNVITHNYGYGIEVNFGGALIRNNTISYTATQYDPQFDFGCDYDDGDGVFVGGTPNDPSVTTAISNNTIENNVGHCEGGGIGLYAAPVSTVISNNIIANNQSLGYGGGVYVANGSASLYQNLIYNNVSGVAGGGVYLSSGGANGNGATGPLTVFVTNNTIYGNTISLNPDVVDAWVDGSQVALPGYVSQLGFFNNLVIGNDSYSAIACRPVYQYLSGEPPVVLNNDVRNTGGATYGGWCTSPAGNTGNISADPKFKNPSNGDFHLQAGSPAIDSGFNAAPGLLGTDLDDNPRIQNAIGASEPVVDMGAYEASGTPESRSTSQTTLTAQPATVFYGQPVSLSATVTDNSSSPILQGRVNFMDDWSVLQQSSLNNSGVAIMSTSSLGVGSHWVIASFGGNTTDQPSISTSAEVAVNGFSTSTTIEFSPSTGHYGQPETLTATVTLGPGNPSGTGTPTGYIAFITSGPNVLATVPLNASGIATYTTPSLPAGDNYIQANYQPTGGFLGSSSQNLLLQILAPPFAISGTPVSVSPGATSGNQSTITITPSGGFTGNVTLTAMITSGPTGAQNPPTLSFGSTSPVDITNTSSETATLTISTTAATSAAMTYPEQPGARSYNITALAFAVVFGIGIPSWRRNWYTRVGLFVFLLALTGGLLACGGNGSGGSGGGGGGNSGTTAGIYTVTVMGTSSDTTAMGTVTLTVQ